MGAGEREAICLALEAHASWVILDDRAGRHVARKLGLQVTGTLGVLLRSKQRGLIPAVRPAVETLVRSDFRASPQLLERVLRDAGEVREQ